MISKMPQGSFCLGKKRREKKLLSYAGMRLMKTVSHLLTFACHLPSGICKGPPGGAATEGPAVPLYSSIYIFSRTSASAKCFKVSLVLEDPRGFGSLLVQMYNKANWSRKLESHFIIGTDVTTVWIYKSIFY